MSAGSTAGRAAAAPAPPAAGGRRSHGYWRSSLERLMADRGGVAGGGVVLAMAVLAVAAPLIARIVTHAQYDQTDLLHTFAGPGGQHWLGTDELGRDTLTRLAYGAQVSLGVGFLAVALYLVIGGAVGIVAGFYRGWLDEVLMRFVDVLLSVPTIFLLILVASLLPLRFGPVTVKHDALSLALVIAVTTWGRVARLIRAEVLSLRGRDFVVAARSLGATDTRLMLRHLLPNVLPVMVVVASLGVGAIILLEAALDFVGLGVPPPTPTWGNMLLNAQTYFFHSWLLVVLPGACVVVTVVGANLFGNAIRDAFDPRII